MIIKTDYDCYIIPEWAYSLFPMKHSFHSSILELSYDSQGNKVLLKKAIGEDWINDLEDKFQDNTGNIKTAKEWLDSLEIIKYSYIQNDEIMKDDPKEKELDKEEIERQGEIPPKDDGEDDPPS